MEGYIEREEACQKQIAEHFNVHMTDVSALDKALGNYEAWAIFGLSQHQETHESTKRLLPFLPILQCWGREEAAERWLREVQNVAG
jgi:hypothetical protein